MKPRLQKTSQTGHMHNGLVRPSEAVSHDVWGHPGRTGLGAQS